MFIFASDFLQVVQKVAERIPVIETIGIFYLYQHSEYISSVNEKVLYLRKKNTMATTKEIEKAKIQIALFIGLVLILITSL